MKLLGLSTFFITTAVISRLAQGLVSGDPCPESTEGCAGELEWVKVSSYCQVPLYCRCGNPADQCWAPIEVKHLTCDVCGTKVYEYRGQCTARGHPTRACNAGCSAGPPRPRLE
ncbi:uncharacterized protein MELLADRAFT_113343 [Melampsora larici-populina 98AG31]|uniref:Secreted protein n=1 Tax=Melampsora larici-populina (strain 98AG31 / pathotype 3-4-7) TaxID=747676 RepID=F4S9K1_MELLP|nr:uncharacterized protein MELLADRAFT_113343 [Melampsora larici-populina 98AG31]EGF98652.1 hypothetical protein MELLADRAFT_113343 [Melampsora larici-populina 98AG31]